MAKARDLKFLGIAIIGALLLKGSTSRLEDCTSLSDSQLLSKAESCKACASPLEFGFTSKQDDKITDCIDEMKEVM